MTQAPLSKDGPIRRFEILGDRRELFKAICMYSKKNDPKISSQLARISVQSNGNFIFCRDTDLKHQSYIRLMVDSKVWFVALLKTSDINGSFLVKLSWWQSSTEPGYSEYAVLDSSVSEQTVQTHFIRSAPNSWWSTKHEVHTALNLIK